MKKSIYFSIASMMMFFTSCFKEKDNWYTNTFKYDGRYSVAIKCEQQSEDIEELFIDMFELDADHLDFDQDIRAGFELMIYNSAANVEDEIIFDTRIAYNEKEELDGFKLKGKFKIEGNPSNFSGIGTVQNLNASTEINDNDDGEFWIFDDYGGYSWFPSDLEDLYNGEYERYGIFPQEEYVAIQMYTRVSMESGKMTPDGKTTIGGNTSDGVELKITTYCDFLVIERYETPKNTWADPGKPEYDWRIKAGSRENADGWEEKWTLDGYRYTGYPEDNPNILPPIIEK